MAVVVVTDSTASLSAEVADARGIVVVPLQVVIGAEVYEEGIGGATPDLVATALKEHRPVSTSRPPPTQLLEIYEECARQGATHIVSVHLSAEMSGTFESAQIAARRASIPVLPVDSRQVGVATGYAALTAADVVARGGSAEEAAQAARERAARSRSFFYVDTLEYLRRGGRVGTTAALLGGALAVKPLLEITDGRVDVAERVRTSARALARLEELAVQAAGEDRIEVTVAHLAGAERAERLRELLAERLADNLGGREVGCAELGAVLGAHVGPGMIAVCVAPLLG